MSPFAGEEKTGTPHTDKTVERKGGTGEVRQPPRSPHAQENTNTQKALTKTPTKLLQRSIDQEHEESWYMRIYIKTAGRADKNFAPSC